jgi:very-short-patch-repair endonuclease
MLWRVLRNRQIAGAKFRRQHQFGPYILDFYCPDAHLAVELDGDSHALGKQESRDEIRTDYLASRNLRVLRFTNREVLDSLEGVAMAIWSVVEPSPNLSQGERDLGSALPVDLA